MNGDVQDAKFESSATAKVSGPEVLQPAGIVTATDGQSRSSSLAISSTALEFLKEEQKQRRAEIDQLIAVFDQDQRYGLAITGAVWSWFATNTDKIKAPLLYVAVFLPAVIMSFFMWRRSAIAGSIKRCSAYVRQLEDAFGVPATLGWERWLTRNPSSSGFSRATRTFWYSLLLVNLAIAVLFIQLGRR